MEALIKRTVAIASICLGTFALIWGVFLINKNTPKPYETEVRFTPPTIPGMDVRAVSQSNGTRYIGGIGIVEPVGEAITIGSQIPGVVAQVMVAPGAEVEKGAALLILDKRSVEADVAIAQANLRAQEAKLNELFGQIAPQRARLDAAMAQLQQMKATKENADKEYTRAMAVRAANALSEEELETRRLNVLLAVAKVTEAEARIREAQSALDLLDGKPNAPTIDVQRATVDQFRAALQREETNLALHTIVAPKTATVLQVKVRAGEFVPASVLATPLITLGIIKPLNIRVDIDESEIPRFRANAMAVASVRGRPDVKVPIQYVRTEPFVIPKKTLNGGVSERVDTRVLQLIYSVVPEQIDALPGQQVDVYIEDISAGTAAGA